MQRLCKLASIVLLIVSAIGSAQTRPTDEIQIAPGFAMRQNGVIDIGDIYVEINYYDSKWTIAQQHDRFEPAQPASNPASATGSHIISGVLTTAAGPANVIERVEAPARGGVIYAATFASEKPLDTNELSVAFLLPLASFGDKEVKFDQQVVSLSKVAPRRGLRRFSSRTIFIKSGFRCPPAR